MKRILVVFYSIRKAQEHEWFVQQIDRSKFHFEFALINGRDSFMESFLTEHGFAVHHFDYHGKSGLLTVTYGLWKLMLSGKYHAVHTHLFEGCLTGLTAAKLSGIKQRIMTRHSSDFHHVYFPSAVKWDKLTNLLATDIVAISENVRQILVQWEGVPERKVHLIHHGIKLEDYALDAVSNERIADLKAKYFIPPGVPVIGTISRFIEWKGLQYIIPAFRSILHQYPGAVLILANAKGTFRDQVLDHLSDLPESAYRVIEFENDVAALYRSFTCFVHTPVSPTAEAFGQIYLESLASRVPSVFSMSGVAPEFAVHERNCLVVPFRDKQAIASAILRLLGDPALAARLAETGYREVIKKFDNRIKISKLEALYSGK